MTYDEIIRMARDVGAGEPDSLYGRTDYVAMTKHEIERFAALVAAAEREACAQLCEHLANAVSNEHRTAIEQRQFCAKAIRARGNE